MYRKVVSEKITLGITYLKISPEKNITYLIKGDSRVPETCIEKVTCLLKKRSSHVYEKIYRRNPVSRQKYRKT